MKLIVNVLKAILTHDTEIGSKMDPFVVCKIGTQQHKSKVLQEGGDMPQWNQPFTFNITKTSNQLHLIVYDQDMAVDDLVGEVKIKISDLISQPTTPAKWYSLKYDVKRPAGKIMLSFSVDTKGQSNSHVKAIKNEILSPNIHPIGYVHHQKRQNIYVQKNNHNNSAYTSNNSSQMIKAHEYNNHKHSPSSTNLSANSRLITNIYTHPVNIAQNKDINHNNQYGYIVQPQTNIKNIDALHISSSSNSRMLPNYIPDRSRIQNKVFPQNYQTIYVNQSNPSFTQRLKTQQSPRFNKFIQQRVVYEEKKPQSAFLNGNYVTPTNIYNSRNIPLNQSLNYNSHIIQTPDQSIRQSQDYGLNNSLNNYGFNNLNNLKYNSSAILLTRR